MGQGCPKCGDLILPPQNEVRCWDTVEKKFREKHGDKYTYIKDTYINAREKMTIVCPVHGRFEQTPASHLIGGCKKCGYDNRIKPWAEVEKMFRKVHGDRYQYNSSTYQKCEVNMTIICPEHGVQHMVSLNKPQTDMLLAKVVIYVLQAKEDQKVKTS